MTSKASAYGTCGELLQGILPDGTTFHVSNPINLKTTIQLEKSFKLLPADGHIRLIKVEQAVKLMQQKYQITQQYTYKRTTSIPTGKGMGSSTADITATIKTFNKLHNLNITEETIGILAAEIESSDGSMFNAPAAFNHKTGTLLQTYHPTFTYYIVTLNPDKNVNTGSVIFTGQQKYGKLYKHLLNEITEGYKNGNPNQVGQAATISAELNQQ